MLKYQIFNLLKRQPYGNLDILQILANIKAFAEFMVRLYLHIRSICVRTLSSMKYFQMQLNVHVTFVSLLDGDDLEFHERTIVPQRSLLVDHKSEVYLKTWSHK
jgi:hypothetical protein